MTAVLTDPGVPDTSKAPDVVTMACVCVPVEPAVVPNPNTLTPVDPDALAVVMTWREPAEDTSAMVPDDPATFTSRGFEDDVKICVRPAEESRMVPDESVWTKPDDAETIVGVPLIWTSPLEALSTISVPVVATVICDERETAVVGFVIVTAVDGFVTCTSPPPDEDTMRVAVLAASPTTTACLFWEEETMKDSRNWPELPTAGGTWIVMSVPRGPDQEQKNAESHEYMSHSTPMYRLNPPQLAPDSLRHVRIVLVTRNVRSAPSAAPHTTRICEKGTGEMTVARPATMTTSVPPD